MAGTALLGRLTAVAELVEVVVETPRVKTIASTPGWPGHRAGQHVDVRLTAEDGYRDELPIASAADGIRVALTVQARRRRGLPT
jgi:ferredoxin-NADP reductase